jgi:hypothetical protein
VVGGAGLGYYRHFEKGSIYWLPYYGAHEVHGSIRDRYALLGYEASYLGYPISDELGPDANNRYNRFEGGSIYWTSEEEYKGAYTLPVIDARSQKTNWGYSFMISGHGFTPNGRVVLQIEGLQGRTAPYPLGLVIIASANGTFENQPWDGRFWTKGGDAVLCAIDQTTHKFATQPIPPVY